MLTSHTFAIVKREFFHANYRTLHISKFDWVRVLTFSIICEIWRLALASLNRHSQLKSVHYELCFDKRIHTLRRKRRDFKTPIKTYDIGYDKTRSSFIISTASASAILAGSINTAMVDMIIRSSPADNGFTSSF